MKKEIADRISMGFILLLCVEFKDCVWGESNDKMKNRRIVNHLREQGGLNIYRKTNTKSIYLQLIIGRLGDSSELATKITLHILTLDLST